MLPTRQWKEGYNMGFKGIKSKELWVMQRMIIEIDNHQTDNDLTRKLKKEKGT